MSLWPATNKMSRRVSLHDSRIATGLLFVVALLSPLLPHAFADICLEGMYREINQPQRSISYEASPTETPLCDDELEKGWYRFTSDAGGEMPTTCVSFNKCGTNMPIWLNGTHPTVADGIVDRSLCINLNLPVVNEQSRCCHYVLKAKVKNCAGFYLYYLTPVPECSMAYCAGVEQACPLGQIGFTPNCQDVYPRLSVLPKVTGPIVEGNKFYFTCELSTVQDYENQMFDVVWTVDNIALPQTGVTGSEMSYKLNGDLLRGHLNKNVGCQVKSYFASSPEKGSEYIKSGNTYWAGIKIEPPSLKVSEAEEEKAISVIFTLPILCQAKCDPVQLTLKQSGAKGTVSDQCKYSIYPADWDDSTKQAKLSVIVKAKRDHMINNQQRQDILALEVISYDGVYDGTFIKPIQVHVHDRAERRCSITGDPHIKGMEYEQYYHLYKIGDYTVYENKKRFFEVQVRTYNCFPSVTCVCAVAIREYNELIKIDNCDNFNARLCSRSPTLTVVRTHNDATSVEISADGRRFGVYLPSSTEVSVVQHGNGCWLDVELTIPSTDMGEAKGICGTFDGIPNNEFMFRDTGLVGTCEENTMGCVPDGFLESWKNKGVQSLFRADPGIIEDNRISVFCTCSPAIKEQCFARQDIPNKMLKCGENCKEVKSVRNPRKRRSTDEYLPEDEVPIISSYDPDNYPDFTPVKASWPTPSGITEQKAEDMCRSAVQTSQLWSLCNTSIEITSDYLESCKIDILVTDSDIALGTYINSFTTVCQYQVATREENYIETEDGKIALKPEVAVIDEVCSLECLKNGRCHQGVCVCNSSFTGSNCQISKDDGPQLHYIYGFNSSSGVCDKNTSPCRRTFIVASNFEFTDALACKVQDVVSTATSVQEATFINSELIACPLQDVEDSIDQSSVEFVISVTMDGIQYGNSINITVIPLIKIPSSRGCERLHFQTPILVALFLFFLLL